MNEKRIRRLKEAAARIPDRFPALEDTKNQDGISPD
jgi:hypothetical protein